MEIPNPQSQTLPPQTNALPMGSPAAAGGNAIVQGFANLSHGLLTYQAYQKQQEQAAEITSAGNVFNAVSDALTQKATEIRKQQAEKPRDPRILSQEYNDFAEKFINDSLNSPSVRAFPYLAKYLSTHLPQLKNSATKDFGKEQENAWYQWDQAQSAITVQGLKDQAIQNPALRDDLMGQIKAHLLGRAMIGTLSGEQVAKQLDAVREDVNFREGLLFAKSHAEEWIAATTNGRFPQGYPSGTFTTQQIKEHDTAAREAFTMGVTKDTLAESERIKDLAIVQEGRKNVWLSRYLPHQDEAGRKQVAEPLSTILAQLTTHAARQELGPQWDTVHSFYHALDQHQKSGGGEKPTPANYNAVLEDIYRGNLVTPLEVLKRAAGLKFDISSTNEVLGKFETEHGHMDKWTQQRVTQSIDVIRGKFALPAGAALDPADSISRMNTVLTRHFLWLEGLRAKGGNELSSADVIGTAQKLADQEYRNMAESVINIIPRTEASLRYKTGDEARAAIIKDNLTERQLNSFLQEIDNFHQLKQMSGGKVPKFEQGRAEAFK